MICRRACIPVANKLAAKACRVRQTLSNPEWHGVEIPKLFSTAWAPRSQASRSLETLPYAHRICKTYKPRCSRLRSWSSCVSHANILQTFHQTMQQASIQPCTDSTPRCEACQHPTLPRGGSGAVGVFCSFPVGNSTHLSVLSPPPSGNRGFLRVCA